MAKILVIDDEPSILLMIKKMLEKEGHLVDIALNGRDGLELFEEFEPALLITDIIMPQKEGLEIILELKKKHPELKIIAISGGGRIGPEGYLPVAKQFGADMVFQKPLVQKEFVKAVSDLIGKPKERNFPMQL
jgi:YesN/AraC family two-component response regulator